MATINEKRRRFIRHFKETKGVQETDMHEVAAMWEEMGGKMPVPPSPRDMLAKQFSEAAGEETRIDKVTKRVYKASLAITERGKDGRQYTLWIDIDDNPPRHRAAKGLHLYREQMVGEAVIGKNTADHWNRNNPDQMPLPFVTDLTEDVNERLALHPKGGNKVA
jgi:hypothetical protein